MTTIPVSDLEQFVGSAGRFAGITDDHLAPFVRSIVEADLRGIDTHGVVRVPAYVEGMRSGDVNPTPEIREICRRGATAVLDVDNGLGGIVGQLAMQTAIDLARDSGIGAVAVRNSNHAGMLAVHVERATDAGMIGYFVSNGPAVMAPWGGKEQLISNNPMAYGFPAGRRPPVVLDMACSAVARGKLRQAAQNDTVLPDGWAVDADGNPTNDPHKAMEGQVLPMAGHKGYGIAVVNEILSAVLPSALFSFDVSRAFLQEGAAALDSWKIGHFAIVIDPDAFVEPTEYVSRIETLIDTLKSATPVQPAGEVLLPGELESRRRSERIQSGIPVSESTLRLVNAAASRWGIEGLGSR